MTTPFLIALPIFCFIAGFAAAYVLLRGAVRDAKSQLTLANARLEVETELKDEALREAKAEEYLRQRVQDELKKVRAELIVTHDDMVLYKKGEQRAREELQKYKGQRDAKGKFIKKKP